MKKINISRAQLIWITCIIAKFLFQIIYVSQIYPAYSYYGFLSDFSLIRCCVSWLLFIPLPLALIKLSEKESFSNMCVSTLLMGGYLPCIVLYIYMDAHFIVYLFVYYAILLIASLKMSKFSFNKSNSKSLDSESLDIVISIIECVVVAIITFIWVVYAKMRINFDFSSEVYVYRMEARSYSMPTFLSYGFAMARAVIPLLIVYNLNYKKYVPALVMFFTQIIIFFVDGTKSTLFNLALELLAYFYLLNGKRFIIGMTKFFFGISTISAVEHILLHSSIISKYIIRRLFFVPALLNYQYFEYFETHEYDYYRQSLGFLGKSPYSLSLAKTIGAEYFGDAQMSANNGLFSDAYANLGFIGVFVMPIAIVFVFKIIESVTDNLPKKIWIVCVIQAFFAFNSSTFFTVLLTHGIIFIAFLLYVITNRIKKTGVS